MSGTAHHAAHARALLSLGLPLIGGHLAQFAIQATDTLMLGWYDVTALAAGVLGTGLFFVLFIMGSGFAWAVMPMVAAAAEGAEQVAAVRRITRMGLWLSALFALAVLPLMIWSRPVLLALGQPAEVSALAADYLLIAGPGLVPALGVMVLKSYLAALERTRIVFLVTLLAALVNVAVNWLLIFGNLGFPELGVRGAAIASLAVHLVSLAVLVLYIQGLFPEHALFARLWRADWGAFGRVFRLGWPIGLTNLAEVGLFTASSVMMGWLGTLPLAAHGIALQIASATFMVHLGLSNAATIRAGRAYGRQDARGLRAGGLVAVALSTAFAGATIVAFLVVPETLIGLFLAPDDPDLPAILAIGVPLLAMAALFQFMDAAQVMALGLLRGVQDTRVPMVHAAVSYWLIGVPCSVALGFWLGWGGVGVWAGLTVGLACAAVLLMRRFWGPALARAVPA